MPFNIHWREVVCADRIVADRVLIVLLSALANLVTKPVATVSGLFFTAAFLAVFTVTERYHHRKRCKGEHKHEEQFNRASKSMRSRAIRCGLKKPYRKLVAIRSSAQFVHAGKGAGRYRSADDRRGRDDGQSGTAGGIESRRLKSIWIRYDRQLMTAVVDRAEKLGKRVIPLIVPTNNPLNAVLMTAKDIDAQEVMLGASNKYTAEEQLDQIALYWINLNEGHPAG